MNCLYFRRTALSDPRRLEPWAVRHAEECPGCRAFHAQELEFEGRLEEALRATVPDGLSERVLSRASKARRTLQWAAHAAVLLISGAAGYFLGMHRPDPLALAGIDFVVYEEAQTLFDPKPTDWKEMVRTAARMGVRIPAGNGDIRFVCVYPFAAGKAFHLLARLPGGKVTVLLLPERPVESRASEEARGLHAVVVPAAKGGLVIVGASGDVVRQIERLMVPS